MSVTFLFKASAIFNNVSVVVVLIAPLSKPDNVVLDIFALFANSSCEIPISSLHSLILYPILSLLV